MNSGPYETNLELGTAPGLPPKEKCRVCGRTDLPILSNGLCTRCDEQKYGRQLPYYYPIWYYDPYTVRIRYHFNGQEWEP